MRRVTREAALAFVHGERYSNNNTTVTIEDGKPVLRLHGNLIAWTEQHTLALTLCGWNTPTTRERLNGLLTIMQSRKQWRRHLYGFTQKNFEAVFDGSIIQASDIIWIDTLTGCYSIT